MVQVQAIILRSSCAELFKLFWYCQSDKSLVFRSSHVRADTLTRRRLFHTEGVLPDIRGSLISPGNELLVKLETYDLRGRHVARAHGPSVAVHYQLAYPQA